MPNINLSVSTKSICANKNPSRRALRHARYKFINGYTASRTGFTSPSLVVAETWVCWAWLPNLRLDNLLVMLGSGYFIHPTVEKQIHHRGGEQGEHLADEQAADHHQT